MTILIEKLKDVIMSVLPISLFVLLLNFTLAPMGSDLLIRFVIGTFLVIIGLGIFLFGVHIGISPIGSLMGERIAKTNKNYFVAFLAAFLGFIITFAEPALKILADQINIASGGTIPSLLIVLVVSLGVGLMVAIGLLRILYEKALNKLFTIIYFAIFILAIFVSEEFLAISVDASGATTGAMATPFILALGYGVSQLKGSRDSEEGSFGLVGLASTGPILTVMLMSIVSGIVNIEGQAEPFVQNVGRISPYLQIIPQILREIAITLLPILLIFLVFDHFRFHLKKRAKNTILKGLLYTYIGLSLFLLGVNGGFMEVGRYVGQEIAGLSQGFLLPLVGFFLGMLVILAEPSVYILTEQIEEVTAGHIKRKVILITLSIGMALAVLFSMLRIMIPALKLWHFLLPGFAFASYLSFKVPSIFVGIAYDAGGVASGPMTATFVLAFAQGAASVIPTANVLVDGFGVIAMVAMMPLVAIQILGLIYKKTQERES